MKVFLEKVPFLASVSVGRSSESLYKWPHDKGHFAPRDT